MTISKQGIFENPQKSPWNFERYQSELELKMMHGFEDDLTVVRWVKRHQISIPWIDIQKHQRRYVPDFLVEYSDGKKAIIEVKDPSRIDSDDVQRKRRSAEIWCKKRHIEYEIRTIK